MPDTIVVENVSKKFGSVVAADNVSFRVAEGSVCALLGGNGAGKTTILSILLGLLMPTDGRVQVMGRDMLRDRYSVLDRMNFSSPYVDLPHRLTVKENLAIYAMLYGLPRRSPYQKRLVEELGIIPLLNKPYGDLSAGQRTRVSMAKALMNEPAVLLLDEPTASLDPDSADRIRSYLTAYQKASGATVLLASHNMNEVERLCRHVIMMKAGRIVDQASPAQLARKYGRTNLEQAFLAIARSENGV